MNNPMEILKSFKGKNPQEIILNQMLGNINNPMIKNLISMAQKGDNKNIEIFARNICNERGINYDKEIANFMKQYR